MADSSRAFSFDILRVLACIGVITIHVAGSPIHHHLVESGTIWYKECMILDGLVRWSVPVFAMLTGFFLINPQKELSLKTLFGKYLARIVLALVFWSIAYSILLKEPVFPIGSQEGHFWYLQMLIGIYLSIPILRLVAQNQGVLFFFCVCWAILMTYSFLGNYTTLPMPFEFGVFGEYSGYCMCAYLLKKEFDEGKLAKKKWFIYAAGIIGLVATLVGGVFSNEGNTPLFSYTSPNVIATSLAIFSFFIIECKNTLPLKACHCIESISKCTFGIYLLHMWILIQVFSRVHRFIAQPVLLTIVCVSIAFFGGFIITWIIRQVPILNRYIV